MSGKSNSDHPVIDPILAIGGIVLLALGAVALLALGNLSNIPGFWFVALLIVVLAALAVTGAVFTGLRLSSGKEAFGLPGGSIRALLAVGIMALLVVFGLHFSDPRVLSGKGELAKPVRVLSVPYDQVSDAIKYNQNGNMEVIVINPGQRSPAKNAEIALYLKDNASVQTLRVPYEQAEATLRMNRDSGFKTVLVNPGQPQLGTQAPVSAEIAIYPDEAYRLQYIGEMGKQLVTAVITLLTSVVGFYFGSRSASDSAKNQNKAPLSVPGTIAVDRKTLDDEVKAAETAAAVLEADLESVRQKPPLPDDEEETQRKQLQAAAETAAKPLADARVALKTALAAADSAIAGFAQVAPDLARQQEISARDALTEARSKLEAFRTAAADLKKQMEPLTLIMAEG